MMRAKSRRDIFETLGFYRIVVIPISLIVNHEFCFDVLICQYDGEVVRFIGSRFLMEMFVKRNTVRHLIFFKQPHNLFLRRAGTYTIYGKLYHD
jgi:hypothetical protein